LYGHDLQLNFASSAWGEENIPKKKIPKINTEILGRKYNNKNAQKKKLIGWAWRRRNPVQWMGVGITERRRRSGEEEEEAFFVLMRGSRNGGGRSLLRRKLRLGWGKRSVSKVREREERATFGRGGFILIFNFKKTKSNHSLLTMAM
jgi:hypothetical protein